jgi:hypothetical protein
VFEQVTFATSKCTTKLQSQHFCCKLGLLSAYAGETVYEFLAWPAAELILGCFRHVKGCMPLSVWAQKLNFFFLDFFGGKVATTKVSPLYGSFLYLLYNSREILYIHG